MPADPSWQTAARALGWSDGDLGPLRAAVGGFGPRARVTHVTAESALIEHDAQTFTYQRARGFVSVTGGERAKGGRR